ncbi:WXG100 family type VII secretion target [Mycobacterium sp. NPDC050853]|uniref:WXG100 family type VII secretion target n=1 Tax=Mycobacterium sp. NPDC050853 TaxID=3155160 RepID=UPI0033D27BF2
MSKDLRVVLDELRRAAHELSKVAERLRSGLDRVDGDVTGVVGATWAGGASEEYKKVWRQWDEGATSVVSGLSGLSGWMADMANEYQRVDSVDA